MNRRSFITSMLAAAVAPMALKGAGRVWKRTSDLWIPNPEYVDAPYEVYWSVNDSMLWTSDSLRFQPFFNPNPPQRFNVKGEEVPPFIFNR